MTLATDLIARRLAADTAGRWTRTTTDMADMAFDLSPHLDGRPLVYVSVPNVVTDQAARTKLLDVHYPAPHVTGGELARQYLDATLELAGRKKIGYRRSSLELLQLAPPVYYAGAAKANVGRWAILDLDAAYWQILSAGTADMSITLTPGGGATIGRGHLEWPRPDEMAGLDKNVRLAVTGYLQRTAVSYYRFGTLTHAQAPRQYLAPDAYAIIILTLQAIAAEAVQDWGCRMILTDSFAVPCDRSEAFSAWLADRWCLTAKVTARGHGALYGLAWYEIAAKGPGDTPKTTKWVENWRKLNARGDPPFQRRRSSNLAWYPPATRDALARARHWLLGRRRTDPGWV